MGQTNLIRTQFDACELITSSANLARQDLAFTGYFEVGDTVDVVAAKIVNGECCIVSTLADNLTILAIETNDSLVFSATVDTTTALPPGATGWYVVPQQIDDGNAAIDRLYRRSGERIIQICVNEVQASLQNAPLAGQTTLYVDDISLLRAGDPIQVIADSGLLANANIVSLAPNADDTNNYSTVVIDVVLDTSAETNVVICSTDLTEIVILDRLRENIDKIDQPVENEFIDLGDCENTVFSTDGLFLAGTSKLLLDGRRLRLGACGTRATHTQGTYPANNDALKYTSMVMGLDGNSVDVSVTAGAGLTVTVSGSYPSFTVDCTDDSGAATAQQIADAINADAVAQRIVQVQYGGDGTGVVAPFAAASMAGGLDDGTGDYCEVEQVKNNAIVNTGFKWVSLHIRPNEKNRLNKPPRDSEELVIDYRKALTNK